MSSVDAWSQDADSITLHGRVLESGSNEPLIGVHVFVSGTTIGSATDRNGRFEFRYHDPMIEYDLVASMIGYLVEVRSMTSGSKGNVEIQFALKPRVYELREVEILGSNREWKRNLERFKELLFSTTSNGRECEVINPEVLDFTYDRETGILETRASEPLRVENKALGYRITLHDVQLKGREEDLTWGGEMQFEELIPRNRRQLRRWNSARNDAYRGSTRHFLTALVSDSIDESGFDVFAVARPGSYTNDINDRPVIGLHPLPEEGSLDATTMRHLFFENVLLVGYYREPEPVRYSSYLFSKGLRDGGARSAGSNSRAYQASWLVLDTNTAQIDDRGVEYGEFSMRRFGYWAWERLGEMLPADFDMDD